MTLDNTLNCITDMVLFSNVSEFKMFVALSAHVIVGYVCLIHVMFGRQRFPE